MIEIRKYHRMKKTKYIECRICKKQIPKNKINKCNICRNQSITRAREGINNNEGENEIQVLREQLGETLQYNNNINKRNYDLKNQGFIDSIKYEDYM